MNDINFNVSGLPLELDIFYEMQSNYQTYDALGELAGNYAILKGCEQEGNTVKSGIVYLGGEVIVFLGGDIQTKVSVHVEEGRKTLENRTQPVIYSRRTLRFGTSTTAIDWSLFKRPHNLLQLKSLLEAKEEKTEVAKLVARVQALENQKPVGIPIGLVAIWGRRADEIPAGWYEYAPLVGRMPFGLDRGQSEFSTVLGFGGGKNKALNVNEMPSHTHKWKFSEGRKIDVNAGRDANVYTQDNNNQNGAISVDRHPIENTGNGQTFSIMNPYRIVMFIEYRG